MKNRIAFWNILGKDMGAYYLKPPNISWGLIFPLAWTGMFFLCGLFFPIARLPFMLQALSYALPLTYGADLLHGAVHGDHHLPMALDLAMLTAFCVGLFGLSLWNVKRRWIA